jgi:uncharacterized protein
MSTTSLSPLAISHRDIFTGYLSQGLHRLAAYHFSNIYLWKPLFEISWMIVKETLCVFFRDPLGCFMYLSPLGGKLQPGIIADCFAVMDRHNANTQVSRIENVEQSMIPLYEQWGYRIYEKPCEYLYLRQSLIDLKGTPFKSKRASCNGFLRSYTPRVIALEARMKEECLALYDTWMQERISKHRDDELYRGLIFDSRIWHSFAFDNFNSLNLRGIVVVVDERIRAYTFGFTQNEQTFCILAEICDLTYNGIAQFIFREFSRAIGGMPYINVLDDSALRNLNLVKESYRPHQKIPSYVISRWPTGINKEEGL